MVSDAVCHGCFDHYIECFDLEFDADKQQHFAPENSPAMVAVAPLDFPLLLSAGHFVAAAGNTWQSFLK